MKRSAERDGLSSVESPQPEREMPGSSRDEITRWLVASREGDPVALEKLLPLVYDELHRQAMHFFSRERSGHTLQPTALVNEVYLRLVNQREANWQNRAQFFGIAAQMMRRILVSHARTRQAAKRGGAEPRITFVEELSATPERDVNLLALDEALTKLETIDPQTSRMVELRFFSGLSVGEAAEVMGFFRAQLTGSGRLRKPGFTGRSRARGRDLRALETSRVGLRAGARITGGRTVAVPAKNLRWRRRTTA